jgi:hypothetical protein
MVKLNEALLVGISLFAALVFSKGRGSLPIIPNIPLINPFTDLLSKAQTQAIEKQESNIETLENIKQSNLNIRESNLGIAKDILDYEQNISNIKIYQLQTELDKTQSFISQQQKISPGNIFNIPSTGGALLSKFDKEVSQWKIETQRSLFPDIYVPFSQSTRAGFAQQARYESAQENIQTANELVFRQQGEIDRLQEEYQTRYGNLSRYG